MQVEGKDVADVLSAIRPVVPAENDQYLRAHGLNSSAPRKCFMPNELRIV